MSFVRLLTIAYISLFKFTTTQNMSRYTAGGGSRIEDFPHSVLLHITCNYLKYCGASILNEITLLSAAHCVAKCTKKDIVAYTGDVREGIKTRVIDFKVHEEYDCEPYSNDIAVLILENDLEFGEQVQSVTLLNEAPKYRVAVKAGWEWPDDNGTKSGVLQYRSQRVMSRETCVKKLGYIPVGTICGIDLDKSTPNRGDSGNALMVHSIIQIGVASIQRGPNNSIVVYTDVPHFYDWVRDAARELYTRNFCAFCDTYLI